MAVLWPSGRGADPAGARIGNPDSEPFFGELLRSFECAACCTDASLDDAADFRFARRPMGMFDESEEPVDRPGLGRLPPAAALDQAAGTSGSLLDAYPGGKSQQAGPKLADAAAGFDIGAAGFNSESPDLGLDPVGMQVEDSAPERGTIDGDQLVESAAAEDMDGGPPQALALVPPESFALGPLAAALAGRLLSEDSAARLEAAAHGAGARLEERPDTEIDGGYSYSGQWLGEERHGQGVLWHPDGIRYIGGFMAGRAHGRGSFVGVDGCKYDGEWDQDQMSGYGKYLDSDGSTYEGEWGQDAKCGRGIECYADGARYEGEFWMGGKHGSGIYRSTGTGVEYEGQYAHDKMDGEGRYKFSDGRAYSGQWAVGHMQGFGKMSWPNGSRYDGGYQQDRKHGDGTFTWPDGRHYCGQWRTGQLDGAGVLVGLDGEEEQQEWVNGDRVGDTALAPATAVTTPTSRESV